ncbi:hypothetical protein [Achromobacter marplatensis]|uniref:hypothetical protein n=1 Tax=Achromobacter marplatensis TaxID=470868 RepID=UPI000277F492|nr:hypothetical protein [Achromobacter marplatensis]EJO27584.1 hypothetical protein QWC_31086 [Achromobacter marplatensis]
MRTELNAWRAAMTDFAAKHVAELAAEIIEWQGTAILRDGKLRELAQMAAQAAGEKSLPVAERFATRAALEHIAFTQPSKDGGGGAA